LHGFNWHRGIWQKCAPCQSPPGACRAAADAPSARDGGRAATPRAPPALAAGRRRALGLKAAGRGRLIGGRARCRKGCGRRRRSGILLAPRARGLQQWRLLAAEGGPQGAGGAKGGRAGGLRGSRGSGQGRRGGDNEHMLVAGGAGSTVCKGPMGGAGIGLRRQRQVQGGAWFPAAGYGAAVMGWAGGARCWGRNGEVCRQRPCAFRAAGRQ
jgi:hypothetical protein